MHDAFMIMCKYTIVCSVYVPCNLRNSSFVVLSPVPAYSLEVVQSLIGIIVSDSHIASAMNKRLLQSCLQGWVVASTLHSSTGGS